MLKRKLFEYKSKVLFSKIKTGVLFVIMYLWLFFPGLVVAFSSKNELFALLSMIMIIVNFRLVSGSNKWFDKLEEERKELYGIMYELNCMIEAEKQRR